MESGSKVLRIKLVSLSFALCMGQIAVNYLYWVFPNVITDFAKAQK